jgi:hypothetical protein
VCPDTFYWLEFLLQPDTCQEMPNLEKFVSQVGNIQLQLV